MTERRPTIEQPVEAHANSQHDVLLAGRLDSAPLPIGANEHRSQQLMNEELAKKGYRTHR